MKTLLSLFAGIALIVAGTALLTYQTLTVTAAERQLHLGPLQAGTQPLSWTFTLPPIAGGVLLAGGTILVVVVSILRSRPRRAKASKTLPDAEWAGRHTTS